jgi:hypothetical protein
VCETSPERRESQETILAEQAPAAAESGEYADGDDDDIELSPPVQNAPAAKAGPASAEIASPKFAKRSRARAQCVVTEETFAADYWRALNTLDVTFSELPSTELANCTVACDLADAICELKDKICDLVPRNSAPSIAERCTDAEDRCARATEAASKRCGCGDP